jgi:hypothetical protein
MSDLHSTDSGITIRTATDADRQAIARIAGRDTAPAPAGRVLVATVGTEVRAAVSLEDGSVVADPFHRTAELVAMLRIRAGAARAHASAVPARHLRQRHRPRIAFRAAA